MKTPQYAIYVNGAFANRAEPLSDEGMPTYFPSPVPSPDSAFNTKELAIQAALDAGYSGFTVPEVYF